MNGDIKLILKAVLYQAEDDALWNPQTVHEAYLVQSLRNLHRVIESGDMEAFESIKECAELVSSRDLSYLKEEA